MPDVAWCDVNPQEVWTWQYKVERQRKISLSPSPPLLLFGMGMGWKGGGKTSQFYGLWGDGKEGQKTKGVIRTTVLCCL